MFWFRGGESSELPPRCESCDGVLKPDAVLFGERLPVDALTRAERYAEDVDAFLVAGSSLTVEPAASLPKRAVRNGATLILVDQAETPLHSRADYAFREDATDVPRAPGRGGRVVRRPSADLPEPRRRCRSCIHPPT